MTVLRTTSENRVRLGIRKRWRLERGAQGPGRRYKQTLMGVWITKNQDSVRLVINRVGGGASRGPGTILRYKHCHEKLEVQE